MFLIIFLWTPPHFWALGLLSTDDYRRAGVPMLPVVAGPDATRLQILLYTIVLAPVGMTPSLFGFAGLAYGTVALVCGAIMLALACGSIASASDRPPRVPPRGCSRFRCSMCLSCSLRCCSITCWRGSSGSHE